MELSAQLREDRRSRRVRTSIAAVVLTTVAVVLLAVASNGDDASEDPVAATDRVPGTETSDEAVDTAPSESAADGDPGTETSDEAVGTAPSESTTATGAGTECDVSESVRKLAESPDDDLGATGIAVCRDGYATIRVLRNYEFGFEELIGVFRQTGDTWEPLGLVIDTLCPEFTDTLEDFPPSLCDLS